MFLMFTAEGTGSKTHFRTIVLPRRRSHALPVYLERTLNLGFGVLILERSGSEFFHVQTSQNMTVAGKVSSYFINIPLTVAVVVGGVCGVANSLVAIDIRVCGLC